jgi:hypothetical protein
MNRKLYKFRSLGTCKDLERAQEILNTGNFWCSRFWELNDPMDGIYWFKAGTLDNAFIQQLYVAKSSHALCSFSGEKAFGDPIMWGYYANGFKGIALEIEVDCNQTGITKMSYASEIVNITESVGAGDDAVRRILTTKLCCWQHEHEYRYLHKGADGLQKIGTITAVYFGNPYKTTVNAGDAQQRRRVHDYLCRVKSLKQTAQDKGIKCCQVDVVDGRVQLTDSDAKDIPHL